MTSAAAGPKFAGLDALLVRARTYRWRAMPQSPLPQPPAGAPADFLDQYAVFAQYGHTMFQVQTFERVLAATVMIAEQRAAFEARAGTPLTQKAFERRVRKTAKRTLHVFHSASASELRNELRGRFDEDLINEIEPLIKWRDFLAHRYLTARVTKGSTLVPEQRHIGELVDLAEAFQAATALVYAAGNTIADSFPVPEPDAATEDAADAYRRAAAGFVQSLVSRQPGRFMGPS